MANVPSNLQLIQAAFQICQPGLFREHAPRSLEGFWPQIASKALDLQLGQFTREELALLTKQAQIEHENELRQKPKTSTADLLAEITL